MTAGNWRNGAGTQGPALMTSMDGTYQIGVLIKLNWDVMVFKKDLVTGATTGLFNLSSVPALVTYGITPIKSDALGGDDHYGIACAIDDRNRTWVAGNSLALDTPHLIMSPPNVISSWTTFTFPYPGMSGSTGGANSTYNLFQRLSTGRLIYHMDQRETSGNPNGKDNIAYTLAPGSDTWAPLVGTGEFLIAPDTGTPERVYLNGTFVEGPDHPHPDRVWIMGAWRMAWSDPTTQVEPFILYNDTVTDQATWKRIDGTAQTMPVTYANTTGSTAVVPIAQPYFFPTNQMFVDRAGLPHFTNNPGAGNTHYWWDGSAWQNETVAAGGRAAVFYLANGAKVFYKPVAGQVGVYRTGSTRVARCGDVDQVSGSGYASPFCDPIQQSRGILHLLVPDGDTPEVCTFGDHARVVAS